MNARTSRPKPPPVDSGDGGVFRAIGCTFLGLVLVVGISALVSNWVGHNAGQTVLNVGVVALVAALVFWLVRGGERR